MRARAWLNGAHLNWRDCCPDHSFAVLSCRRLWDWCLRCSCCCRSFSCSWAPCAAARWRTRLGISPWHKLHQVYATLPYLRMLAWSALAIAGGVAVIATSIGVGLAWLIARTDIPARQLMEGAVMAPLFLSAVHRRHCLADPRLAQGRHSQCDGARAARYARDQHQISSLGGILLMMTLYYIPYAYLTISAALRNIDPSMEEASYLQTVRASCARRCA